MPSLTRSTWSVGAVFFVNGFVFSNWIPRINEVRDRLGVSNSGLGLALVSRAVSAMGGSMEIGNAADGGFVVTLRLRRAA